MCKASDIYFQAKLILSLLYSGMYKELLFIRNNDPPSKYPKSLILLETVPVNAELSIRYLRELLSIYPDNYKCTYYLARILEDTIDTNNNNPKEAFQNYKKLSYTYTRNESSVPCYPAMDTLDANYRLGKMYEEGRGISQNYKEAVRNYKLAIIFGESGKHSYFLNKRRINPKFRMEDIPKEIMVIKKLVNE